ncbi:MAG: hypothetical protein LBV41_09665 [Cytophagaceae bacterium]|nr:hypothetical protein [Cytophagaceae bacterium]
MAYRPAEKGIDALKLLVSYRNRLVKNKVSLEVAATEMRRVIKRDPTARFMYIYAFYCIYSQIALIFILFYGVGSSVVSSMSLRCFFDVCCIKYLLSMVI